MTSFTPPLADYTYYSSILRMHEREYRKHLSNVHAHRYWVLREYLKPFYAKQLEPIPEDIMAVAVLEGWVDE